MNKELIKKNFYNAVNEKWLETAVIPDDQPSMSAFLELHLDIEKLLMDLTKKWVLDPSGLNKNLKNFIKYYKMTSDFNKRAELGTTPIKPYLDRILSLGSLKDLENNAKELLLDSIDLPLSFSVMQDFKDSNNQILYFGLAGVFLPDTTYYKDEATKEQLLGLFRMTSTQLLLLYGYTPEEANTIIEETLAFDALLVPVTKSREESADYVKLYNPYDRSVILDKIKNFNVMALADKLVGQKVDKLIFINPDHLEHFDEVINENNFKIMKSWMILQFLLSFSSLLTDELRIAGGAFSRALSGTKEARSKEKHGFYQAYNRFNQAVGLYYGENYFGPVAKNDVTIMVHEMINVYKERIQNNDWLQDATKAKAIKKLDTLSVHVGYPDELPPYYEKFNISSYEEGSNIVEENVKNSRITNEYQFSQYNKKRNKNLWGMPASMVNAYFNPTNNQIVFPAAILQKPYYSLDQSSSANYGGIGAVIAHEISHAFDNNGAKFDENGSLSNWWTEQDLESFNKKAEDMITLFDGVQTEYGPCNGKLTVSENIADSGGIRAAYNASKNSGKHSNDDFFQNWARVWRQKSSPEYAQLLLNIDVHGPAILRANMQLSNMPEFQEHYGITKEDEMYLPKEKMVSIW